MTSSSVQYQDLPINKHIMNCYFSSTLNFYYGYTTSFQNIIFGSSSTSYSNDVGFFMNLDMTNSCMTVSTTTFYTPSSVTWTSNTFSYTT